MSAYALLPLVSMALIVTVEVALIAEGRVLAGQIGHAALLLLLLNAGAILPADSRDARSARAAMHALALVPLIRVVGAGLPMSDLSTPVEELLVAVPVGAAALALAPVVGVSRGMFVAARHVPLQAGAMIGGLGLGLAAYLFGAAALWPADAADDRVALSIAVAIATAAVQEFVFRGVVQVSLQRAAGRIGLLGAIVLFSATLLGAGSAGLVMTGALAGVVFAHVVARTATLGGAVVGHALFAVGAGAIWPALLGRDRAPWSDESGPVILVAAALIAVTATVLARPPALALEDPERDLDVPHVPAHPPDRHPQADRRSGIVALACLLIIATGIGGYFVGKVGEQDGEPDRRITVGQLSLRLPGDWHLRPAGKALPRARLKAVVAGGPRQAPRAGIVVWRARTVDETFIPDGFIASPRQSIELVRLTRYDAFRHRGLRAVDDRLVPVRMLSDRLRTTTYSIPATSGAVAVACHSPPSMARTFMAECERVASTVSLRGLGGAERGTVADDLRRLYDVMAQLAERRAAGRQRLSAARTPRSQARAARDLQRAYRAARSALRRSRAGPATRRRQAALVATLGNVDAAYGALVRAASRRSSRRYRVARGRIASSEAALRRLLHRSPIAG